MRVRQSAASWPVLLLTVGLGVGCSRQPRGASPVATASPAPVATASFGPGRFAGEVRKDVFGTHQMNVYRETTHASLLLDLSPGGSVTGGRGILSNSTHDGPEVHDRGQRKEQQGYRGSWAPKAGGVIEIELTPDDTTLPAIRAYTNLAPGPWRLLCKPKAHATGLILLCDLASTSTFQEAYGLEVPHLEGTDDQRHIILGAGPGVSVKWESSVLVGDPDSEAEVSVTAAAKPLTLDSWSQP